MISTRPTPPWSLPGYATQTFLEKRIVEKRVFVDPTDTRIFNIEYAREYVYEVPSIVWTTEGE
jgi:hypothetical protein